MSNAVSALNRASFHGIADVAEDGLCGMITLRGNLASTKLKSAAKAATGVAVPKANLVNLGEDGGICWMSPDELLLLVPYDDVATRLAAVQKALAGDHALAVDVSDARAVFTLSGLNAREVLAKLAPVDLSPDVFTPGMIRRSRLAQVPAAFWMTEDESFRIVCFRSVAQYVCDLLSVAAQDGSEAGIWTQ